MIDFEYPSFEIIIKKKYPNWCFYMTRFLDIFYGVMNSKINCKKLKKCIANSSWILQDAIFF